MYGKRPQFDRKCHYVTVRKLSTPINDQDSSKMFHWAHQIIHWSGFVFRVANPNMNTVIFEPLLCKNGFFESGGYESAHTNRPQGETQHGSLITYKELSWPWKKVEKMTCANLSQALSVESGARLGCALRITRRPYKATYFTHPLSKILLLYTLSIDCAVDWNGVAFCFIQACHGKNGPPQIGPPPPPPN